MPIIGYQISEYSINNISGQYGGGLAGCDGLIINCVIVDNWIWFHDTTYSGFGGSYGGGNLSHCDGEIRNCIIWGEGEGRSDIGPGVEAVITFSNVLDGWEGEGNISVYPYFADPFNGDYHLRSAAGRWDGVAVAWVYDDVTSLCIDAGQPEGYWDPNDTPNNPNDDVWVGGPKGNGCGELWPHGGRVNMGAYGGGREASMSLSSVGMASDLDCDGGVGFYDFGLFGDEWGYGSEGWSVESGGIGASEYSVGRAPPYRSDFDRDGGVGLGDLLRFAEEWLVGLEHY